MSRGRPRHHSSRRRMYSPRQRDVRERRVHERGGGRRLTDQVLAIDADDGVDYESPSAWGVRLSTRAGAA